MPAAPPPTPPGPEPGPERPPRPAGDLAPRLTDSLGRLRRWLLGRPKSLADRGLFEHMALVPFLAWVGLGADGLSSSSYGPEEAFRALGEHTYLAVGLALMTAVTVLLISTAYARIIEAFPHGGGGYVVATKLLGERVGVVSGCALLIDYVLTVTVSVAAAGDALFSFLPAAWAAHKLWVQVAFVVGLTWINLRGIRESVMSLMPVFVAFLIMHVVLIGGAIVAHLGQAGAVAARMGGQFRAGLDGLGAWPMLLLFLHAYSLGGGTYTGIEAVSNGLPIMREPRARTARITMIYMAISLAVTAAGLLVAYLLWDVAPVPGKTLNAVLAERLTASWRYGHVFVVGCLLSEGLLLVGAAQAGFIDGPRVLANMANDSWVPRRFGALSERLTTQNGILLMGSASLAALVATQGDVRALVVMYSINVFVTFSLSMFGMLRTSILKRRTLTHPGRDIALFAVTFAFCALILGVTVLEKFAEGGWVTLVATAVVVAGCYLIRGHYRQVGRRLAELYASLSQLHLAQPLPAVPPALDPARPTAVVLVAHYGGLGVYTFLNIFKTFPGHFHNVVFVAVGVIDSGEFKGHAALDALGERTGQMLTKYVHLAQRLGVPATSHFSLGTDAVAEAEKSCRHIAQEFLFPTFFAGRVVFDHERWYQGLLHNETATALQRRLQYAGLTMVVLPARVH